MSADALETAFIERFLIAWDEQRVKSPGLPEFNTENIESSVPAIVGEAWSFLRLLDRDRVNNAIRAVLAPLAAGADLDNIVARANVQRLTIREATFETPAVMETDAALLRRYLLAFDRPSAGSRDRYLYEAWTAWPEMGDCRVNGRAIHGRRGETDIVVIGPGGRAATDEEKTLVRNAVLQEHVRPEAVAVRVVDATRVEYASELVVEIAPGPDAEIVRMEALGRVQAAAAARILIGAEIPDGFIRGAAYGANIIKVRDLLDVIIEPDPYSVPVPTTTDVAVEVRP
nr:baseplate J/gp47 family protein [Aurantimonas sp. DM33-3]